MALYLVDSYVVEIEDKEDVQTRASGIVVVETGQKKVPNFGTVIHAPSVMTEKKLREYDSVYRSVLEGDKVFFPVNMHYSYIEREGNAGIKWMIVPIENIQAIWKDGE